MRVRKDVSGFNEDAKRMSEILLNPSSSRRNSVDPVDEIAETVDSFTSCKSLVKVMDGPLRKN